MDYKFLLLFAFLSSLPLISKKLIYSELDLRFERRIKNSFYFWLIWSHYLSGALLKTLFDPQVLGGIFFLSMVKTRTVVNPMSSLRIIALVFCWWFIVWPWVVHDTLISTRRLKNIPHSVSLSLSLCVCVCVCAQLSTLLYSVP